MKSTGIVRRIDELGRLVIPKELRRTLDINECDSLEIFTDEDRVIIKKYEPGCKLCGELSKGYLNNGQVKICTKCYENFK